MNAAGAFALPIASLAVRDLNVLSYLTGGWPVPDCMEVTVDGATTTVRALASPCTTDLGVEFSGAATFVSTEADSSGMETSVSTYDHFGFWDPESSGEGYAVDGSWSFVDDGGGGREWALAIAGSFVGDTVDRDGAWELTLSESAGSWQAGGYVDVVSQSASSVAGDFCFASQHTSVDSCDSEDDGTDALTGTATAILTRSGSTSCDGCADVSIDGADAGVYCPE